MIDWVYYNVAHASNEGEQERELRLWFKPADFSDRAYREPLDYIVCKKHYYLTEDGIIIDHYMPGSLCIAAPSDILWKSDMKILEDHLQNGRNAKSDLRIAVAKYKLNLDNKL